MRRMSCSRPWALFLAGGSRPFASRQRYRRFRKIQRDPCHDWRFERLAVPCLSVTVDLVGGNSVVRERGMPSTRSSTASLARLSVPIGRDGQALIDGGIVNNIPADVLVSMGCNFVIAVSVTAKLEMVSARHQNPGNPLCPGKSRASGRRSCAVGWFKTTT